MAKAWGNTKAPSKGETVKVADLVDLYQFKADYSAIRLVGPVTSVAFHWIDIITKEGKKVPIPKVCLNWNSDTESFDSNGCPYCELMPSARVSSRYYANAIIREYQEAEPRKKSPPLATEKKPINLGTKEFPFKVCVKEKGSKTWTPFRVIDFPATVANKLVGMSETNRRKIKVKGKKVEQTFPLSDQKYGCDVEINLKKGGSHGFGEYDIQRGEKSSVSDEEMELLFWDLNKISSSAMAESLAQATKEAKGMVKRLAGKSEDDDDDDDDDDDEKSSKSKRRKKSKRDPFEDLDDDDDDADMDDDDDDDEPRRKKKSSKKKSSSSSRKKKRDPLEDLEDELDSERRRKKKKSKTSTSSKSSKKRRR